MSVRPILVAAAAVAIGLRLVLAAPAVAHSGNEPYQKDEAFLKEIGFDQRLGEQVPLDLTFRDELGAPVALRSFFSKKPVIMLLTYYNCTMLCPLLLDGLVRTMRGIAFDVGKQFNVLTVSINPREGPVIASQRKELYIQRYGRRGAEDGWHFLTGQEPSIRRLAQAIGYRYVYDAKKDEYAHAAGILLLTPEGRVSRYLYGVEFSPRDLRLGLVEAAAHTIGSPVDQLLLYCYHYDPLTGKYGVIIMNVLRLAGFATVLMLGTFMLVMFRRDRRGTMQPGEAG
jgi:protein SCO1/2